jgi:hypothetical protein
MSIPTHGFFFHASQFLSVAVIDVLGYIIGCKLGKKDSVST